MENFRSPNPMEFEGGNLADKWKKWKQKFLIFMDAAIKDGETEKRKLAILLNLIGEKGQQIFNTFKVVREEAKLADVLKLYGDYCEPKKNLVFERFQFYSVKQSPSQSMENFVTEVKTRAASCEFKEEDNMVRDRLVMGVCNSQLQERLLLEADLTLKKCEEIIRTYGVSKQQVEMMSQEGSSHDAVVDKIKISQKHHTVKNQVKRNYKNFQSQVPNYHNKSKITDKSCSKCGRTHEFKKCFAYGKMCNFCKKMNHFESCCLIKGNMKFKNVNEVVEKEECFYVESMNFESENFDVNNKIEKEWLEIVVINNKTFRFKLDTGAQCNVLPAGLLAMCNDHQQIQPCSAWIITYDGSRVKAEGTITLKCNIAGKIQCLQFYVVKYNAQPILGLKTCIELNLIKRVNELQINSKLNSKEMIINEFKTVFEGLGKFPGPPCKLTLNEDAVAKVFPPRRIPKSLTPSIKFAVDKLLEQKVIKKVNGPTQWVNNVVIVQKPNSDHVRICLDPFHLNKEIKRDHYAIPTTDEILSDLAGMSYFSVLDLKDSFYQIVLDEESSKLCTFALSNGKYRFLRLPFGINTSAELFQRKNMEIFGHIPGVKIYIDDLVVYAKDEKTHDKILINVLDTAREAGITFNKDKFQYKKTEIKLLGFNVSKKGVAIDKKRIDSILKLEEPKNKKELLRLLGLVKYLGKFIPNMTKITANLRELTKEKILWSWEQAHMQEFNYLKSILTEAPILAHYDVNKQLLVQSDASKDGLGCVILQEGRPLAYASRSLNDCEKRYAPIERELLAIVFAVERFNYYTYGRKINVQTDHKPLISIFKKDLNKISSRLQRMILRLMKYDLEIQYKPGKELNIPDTLSRSSINLDKEEVDKELNLIVHTVVKNLPISDEKKEILRKLTESDEVLCLVKKYMESDWPKNIKSVQTVVKPYYNIKNYLNECGGLLFFEDRLIIPSKARMWLLRIVHEGHLGIVKCKNRARECMYWPGINKDLEIMINNCEICEKFRANNSKMPLKSHEIPNRPWAKLGIDIAELFGDIYLIVVDYYSKWIEIKRLKNKTCKEIINKFECISSYHGYPDIVISDNSPFNSLEFREYLKKNSVELITISPLHSQSNGQAEASVKIAKNLIKKAKLENKGFDKYLLQYRNAPLPDLNLSPAQLLFSRRLKDNLPCIDKLLFPKVVSREIIKDRFNFKQQKQQKYFNRNTRSLVEGKEGDRVLFKTNNKNWKTGIVAQKCKQPRSYIIEDDYKNQYRRNRQHFVIKNRSFNYADLICNDKNIRDTNKECIIKTEPVSPMRLRDRRNLRSPVRLKYD